MSETDPQAAAPDPAPAEREPTTTTSEPFRTEPAAADPPAVEASPEPTADPEPPKPKDPSWVKPAMDRLTREKHEARRELDLVKAELALLRARAESAGEPPAQDPPATATPELIRAEAEKLRAQERANERLASVIADGVKEFSQDVWTEKTNIVAQLGATDNAAFMQALMELPDAHRLVTTLADEPDKLQALLAKPPVAMATEMGRMAAELAAPKPRKLSAAPAPVTPVSGRASAEPSVYDTEKLSMKEWVALRNKQAPAHLGGVRRAR